MTSAINSTAIERIPRGLDPQLARVLTTMPVVDLSDLALIRRLNAATKMPLSSADQLVSSEDRRIAPAGGTGASVRICRPRVANAERSPCILYFHPGLSFGTLDMDHARCLRYAAEVDAVVVSVDYRLAPEAPFPAGLEDCYAALVWVRESAAELGVDPTRIAVAGCSTGATLAAALALLARDRGGPPIAFQLLLCPATDDRLETPSMRRFEQPGPMEAGRVGAEYLWRYYLGNGSVQPDQYAAPARAETLTGLPPAYVAAAEFDCVRDEGIDYGMRLMRAGIPTELHLFSGCFHAFDLVARTAAISQRAVAEQIAVLRRALSRPAPPTGACSGPGKSI